VIDCKRLVILDRDGVINEDSDDFIKSVDEWVPLPGSIEAIASLKRCGLDGGHRHQPVRHCARPF